MTDDETVYERCKKLHEYGQEKKYHHISIGVNSRMDTIQAAVLRVKLKYLDGWNKKRTELARIYERELNGIDKIQTPKRFDDRAGVFHVYCVRAEKRDMLMEYLQKHGIGTLIHYPIPLHLQKAFSYLGYQKGDFPVAESLAGEILSLPLYPELPKDNITYVVDTIRTFYE